MLLGRAETEDGVLSGEITDLSTFNANGKTYDLSEPSEARLVAPCQPSAMYCIGRNYVETIEQMEYDVPDEPTFFIKPPASVLSHGDRIPYPSFSDEVTYAGELAAVIGERCSKLDPEDVPDVVLGYTIMNDVDALDQPNLTARKAFDGSGPLGPWIDTELDPTNLDMWTYVNDEKRQSSNTELMIFDPFEIIAYLSNRFTFRPGDVVAFGSPANPGLIEPGDVIEITYKGLGTLQNTVGFPQ